MNGDFESPDVGNVPPTPVYSFGTAPYMSRIYNESDVPGWETDATDNLVELWQSGHLGVTSFQGGQHAELNATVAGAFYQDIATSAGTQIVWSFAHRGRDGTDTLRVLIGKPGGPMVGQGDFSTGNTAWSVKRGSYTVPAGQTVTRFQFLSLASSSSSSGAGNFLDAVKVVPSCDYGDAPSSFGVTRANSGAAHRIQPGAFLGTSVDGETDGNPSSNALGDNSSGSDDEDGVTFGNGASSDLIRNTSNPVVITASAAGYVNLWIDLNGDGSWQSSERLLADVPVSAGSQTFGITIPISAVVATSFARVRYSTNNPGGSMGPDGDWANGEVEDYAVKIIAPGVVKVSKTSSVYTGSGFSALSIPGNDVAYKINVANIGGGPIDNGSAFIVDSLPVYVEFFNGDADGPGPGTNSVNFSDSGSSLSFNPATDLRFSNGPSPPSNFAACTYSPGSGYDPGIKYICLNPKGVFPSGASAPNFDLSFRVRIK